MKHRAYLLNHFPGLFALLLGTALLTPGAAHGDNSYLVTVNTSSLAGQSGNLDFQFEGGPTISDMTITGFTTDGMLVGSPIFTGDASGALGGTLLLNNGTGYNDAYQAFTFGTTLSFDADLSGAALTPPAGTSTGSNFALSLFDPTGMVGLLTGSPNDDLADIGTDATGAPVVVAQPNVTGGPSVATITPLAPAPSVPEPGSLALLALGLVPVGLLARRRA